LELFGVDFMIDNFESPKRKLDEHVSHRSLHGSNQTNPMEGADA